MALYQNKYRIEPARLQTWDYSSEGAYFLTICTKDRKHYFGEVENGKMKLSHLGVIADILWYEIVKHAKNVELGEFVVMPNHIHGIILLHGVGGNGNDDDVEKRHAFSPHEGEKTEDEEKRHAFSEQEKRHAFSQQRFQNQGKNTISSIIGSYKSALTKHANRLGFEFAWQPSFYDHIIRDSRAFENIQNYIVENPARWGKDTFNKKKG